MKDLNEAPAMLADVFGADTPTRAHRTMIEANVGLGPREAAEFETALGPEFCMPLQSRMVDRQSPHEIVTGAAAKAQWRQLASDWLASHDKPGSREPMHSGWSIALDAESSWFDHDGALRYPCLPWVEAKHARQDPRAFLATGGGSRRGIDLFQHDDPAPPLNVKCSLGSGQSQFVGLPWQQRAKRNVLEILFGLEATVDLGALRRLDVLQGLWITACLREGRAALPRWLEILEETEAMGDTGGEAAVLRRYPKLDGKLMIPVYAFAHGRSAKINLVRRLTDHAACDPVAWALSLGRKYLCAWWSLFLRLGLVMTMPHAQNAFALLDSNGQPAGLMIKDLRDIDHVSTYAALSQQSVRLQGICKSYLAYEMRVHPIYFDVAPWRRAPIEEALFNFTFQMLHNHVFRGLEASLETAEQAADLRTGLAETVLALAEGADPEAVDDAATGRRTPTMLTAMRALRQTFVKEYTRLA